MSSNFSTPVHVLKIYRITSWQLCGRSKSCNLIGPFGIPKGKGVCDEKVRLEHQTVFRREGVNVWARDYGPAPQSSQVELASAQALEDG